MIDLPTIQKKLNLHYTLSLDLFGSRGLDQCGECLQCGLKGRYRETQIEDDHQLKNDTYPVLKLVNGEIKRVDEPALTALNMRLRDDYTQDCVKGLLRWNKIITLAGYDYKLALPNVAFHRQIGEFKDMHATPDGVLIDDADVGEAQERMAALDRRRRLHRQPDEAGDRAGQVRLVDLAAQGRHRQQAGRFRIREDRDVIVSRYLPACGEVATRSRGRWWLFLRSPCPHPTLGPASGGGMKEREHGRAIRTAKPGRAADNTRARLREIGARVRNERAKRGMTRKMLAEQCQTSERYLAQIELGDGNPSVLVLDAIARALGLDPFDLMPGGGDAARPAPAAPAQLPR